MDSAVDVRVDSKHSNKPSWFTYLSALIWILFFVETFVFDYISYIFTILYPHLSWIAHWRILQISVLLLLVFVFLRNKKKFFYLLFFPFILFLWKIPKLVLKHKQWYLGIAVIKAFSVIFGNSKNQRILNLLYIIALIITINVHNQWVVIVSSITMIVVLVASLCIQAAQLIWPLNKTSKRGQFRAILNEGVSKTYSLNEELKNTPVKDYNAEQQEEWLKRFQNAVLTNRLFLFGAKKLNEYKKSSFEYLCKLLHLVLFATIVVLSFGLVYYKMHAVNPKYFIIEHALPSLLTFMFFSFDIFASSELVNITCTLPALQVLVIIEKLFAILYSVFFLGSFISIWKTNNDQQIDKWVVALERKSTELEMLIKTDYNYDNIEMAMMKLKEAKASLAEAVYYFTEKINS